MKIYRRINIKDISVLAFVFVFYFVFYYIFKSQVPIMDERFHYPQIVRFSNFDFTHDKALAMGPGYHFLLSLPFMLIKNRSIELVRLFNYFISMSSILVFYLTTRKISKKGALLKTLLYSFFALNSFHFLFLYTDNISMLFLLLSFRLVLSDKFFWAGMIAVASLFVRQTNVVYMGFIYICLIFKILQPRCLKDLLTRGFKKVLLSGAMIPWHLGFALFILYFLKNPSLSYGSGPIGYSSTAFSLNNLYFLAFLAYYLFLPENLAVLPSIIASIRKKALLSVTLSVLLFTIFMLSFENKHPWNVTNHLLRNVAMILFTLNLQNKIIFFLSVLYSVFVMAVTQFEEKYYGLLYFFGAFSLVFIWLVEPRYYMPFFAFYILLRKNASVLVGSLVILLNITLSVYLMQGTYSLKFYP